MSASQSSSSSHPPTERTSLLLPADPMTSTKAKADKPTNMMDDRHDPEAADDVEISQQKQLAAQGNAHFHRLGWKRLAIVTIVEAVALGALSLPSAYHTLGMFPGVFLTITLGLVSIYTSYLVGQVKLKFPHITSYADAGRLLLGRFGYELFGLALILELVMVVGSHALTGSIALIDINGGHVCSIVFSAVSAIILFILAIPPSFTEVAILGYIDFVSILAAIGITVIATGIQASDSTGGLSGVEWSAWPKENLSFAEGFVAVSNIIFAFSFAIGQFSFMDEMHTPTDYMKSIYASCFMQISIYTLTGALCYAFIGPAVQSPALLSAGPLVSKIAFGVALPVIFISGSINSTVALRYLHGRMFKDSILRYVNTPMGWVTWISLAAVFTIIAWVIAEAIPIFSDLLSLASALFVSGFSFWIPGVMWFALLCEGKWFEKKNLLFSLGAILAFIIGIVTLGAGTYATIKDIIDITSAGNAHSPFACRSS
ncbi:transmembrane amino acid transporter protein-domain-containing protein [Fusarium flagelliforme]|uniref:Putative neutral amino acid permease n=1 Tax=Fusarium flagelliforme TaxID=2675880 RepID=A0A395M4S5_9HYPO|nr:transmembrane amino acid transporter protein-domain-containing protein [Fusarium flagelliforme]KAH7174487.1 transmembrane amino acid transporter protein-domain-containing protein [Fusarium flagelliforme]RFN42110.1 putative neutral amino acid permease [Fusarium flagelliforme]